MTDFRHRSASLVQNIWALIVTMTHSLRILPPSGVMSSFPWQKCLTLKPDLAKNAHVSSSEKMYPIIEEEDSASSDDISNVKCLPSSLINKFVQKPPW